MIDRMAACREQAREHLAPRATAFREMGMAYWLERAEWELTAQ